MYKLIKLEWIKFINNRKNKMILLLGITYIIGFILYNLNQYAHYFSIMEKSMIKDRDKASNTLNITQLLKENDENYKENLEELLFLNTEVKKTLLLEYFYKNLDLKDWKYILQIENQKFQNLILGAEKKFVNETVLNAKGQSLLFMKSKIIQNQYLIDNNIVPRINPYEINGINFLLLLLRGYNPLILIVLTILFSIDIFSSEIEEGTYKLYFTQPYSRKSIYFSKIFSALLFPIGLVVALIILSFIIICLISGVGKLRYPETMIVSKGILSFKNNLELLGNFQIVSSIGYITLGYTLMFSICCMLLISNMFLSIILKSTTKTLGIFTYIILIDFIINVYMEKTSLIRFYSILTYIRVEEVLKGQINSSYIVGILIAFSSMMLTISLGKRLISKMDFVDGEK